MNRLKKFLFKNTSEKQTAVKNTVWLFTGEIAGRLLKFAIVVFATRKLGITGWGVFSYALAFVSFFYILADLGINTFTIREMSRDSAEKYKHLSTSFIIKVGLLIILFTLSLLIGPHVGKIYIGLPLLATLSILFFSDCLREFALSVIRSLQKMEQEAFSKVIMNVVITVAGILLILKKATPLSLALAYALGSIVGTVFVLWSIRSELRHISWGFSKQSLRIIYDFSWPIMIISLFSFVFNIDSIMLGQLRSAGDVGLYAAAQRIVQFMAIIPSFIAMAAFPILSNHETDNDRLGRMLEKILVTVFAIGIPLAVGSFLIDTKLMSLVFGQQYTVGGLTLGILMLSILASFPNIVLTNVIFSKNLQRTFIAATSIGVAVNIVLNLVLITRYGAIGAALSVGITQMLIMIINWQKLKKVISFSVIPKLGIIVISSVIMALTMMLLKNAGLNSAVIAISAMILYAALLYFLKEPALEELLVLVKLKK
jgi:O-antigen/teichoic acid export membrane protein